MVRDFTGRARSGVARPYQLAIGPPREEVRVVAIDPAEAAPRGLDQAPVQGEAID